MFSVTKCYDIIYTQISERVDKLLPKRLKEIRTEKEKTQQEIANYLGITRPAYTAYESGNRQPDYETLQRLADFFNVTTDFLLGRTDTRNETTPEQKIKNALSGDPELSEFWESLSQREDLKILFKQTRDMSPEAIKRIIRYIKIVEDEEASEEF